MVDYFNKSLGTTLIALADPTRRAILKQLSRKSCTVNELAEPHDMSLAGISKHLMVLEKAKLVIKKKEGRTQHCRLNPQPMKGVAMLLLEYKAFWENQLDALEIYMKKTYRKESMNSTDTSAALVVKRILSFPPDPLFKAFPDPSIMSKWFFGGPDGFSQRRS